MVGSVGRYNKFTLPEGGDFSAQHIQANQYSVDLSYAKRRIDGSVALFYKHGNQSTTISKIAGGEVYARYRFSEHLRAQLSLSSLNATETINGRTSSSRYDIHYFLRGNAEYKFGGTWTATAVFLFRQGSFYTPVTSAAFHPATGTYQPVYGDVERLSSYRTIDLSVSKLMIWGENANAIAFCGINNVPDWKNTRGYFYNADYTTKSANLFSLRTIYFGYLVNFQKR